MFGILTYDYLFNSASTPLLPLLVQSFGPSKEPAGQGYPGTGQVSLQ